MGNLQTNEGKPNNKTGKSPGKVKNLKKTGNKLFGGKNRKEDNFTSIVPDENETHTPEDTITVPEERSTNFMLNRAEPDQSQLDTVDQRAGKNTTQTSTDSKYVVSDSWKQINKLNSEEQPANSVPVNSQQVTPPSGESSSDSVFTDPLTSVGFAAEINQCYYSEESVNIEVEVPDLTGDGSDPSVWPPNNVTLNSFKLNEYKQRREQEINKKIGKLGVSKTSQISLDDIDGCFVSGDVLILDNNMPLDDSPEDMGNTNNTDASGDKTPSLRSSYYRPRKIELVSTRIAPDNGVLPSATPEHKRHLSMSDTNTITESNVLRKVASLTLERNNLEKHIVKPKFVPEKLDFKIYEKFEGHMLVNWYISEFGEDHYLKSVISVSDLKLLAAQFCTHLLVAGVLCQLPDKDVPQESVFRMDLMYYWAHMEVSSSVPQTPGKLSTLSWPPVSPGASDVFVSPCSYNEFPRTPVSMSDQITKMNGDFTRTNDVAENKIKTLEEQIIKLKQELERYKTLADIQTLTSDAVKDFGSPVRENPIVKDYICSVCKCKIDPNSINVNNDVQKSLNLIVSSVSLPTIPADTQTVTSIKMTSPSKSEANFNTVSTTKSIMSPVKSEIIITKLEPVNNSAIKTLTSVTQSSSNKENVVNSPPKSKEVSPKISPINESKIIEKPPSPKSTEQIETLELKESLSEIVPSTSLPDVVPLNKSPENSIVSKEISLPQSLPVKQTNSNTSDMPSADKTVSLSQPEIGEPPPSTLPVLGGPPPPPPMPEIEGPVALPMPEIGGPPPPIPDMSGPPPPPMPEMTGPPPPPMPEMCGPPPPPMPGMCGPPPPPMPGIGGPPPPPMPGMGGPPPPPMPGMGGPLPPPMPGMGGPPPPPMPGMGGPPPPPPIPGIGGPPPPPMPGMGGPPPPPPPGAPPPPNSGGPVPFPVPPAGGWNPQKAVLRKPPVNPSAPMKPLYWTRIVIPTSQPVVKDVETNEKPLWLILEETKLNNLSEFTDLFSRQVVTRKPVKKKTEETTKILAKKILDSKRSQNVGILAQSLHVEFSEIENAIYNFDTSIVSLEALQQIYEARATSAELTSIKSHKETNPTVPLDKPEQFLYDLSEISNFAYRISCFMFQTEFEDSISTIDSILTNLKSTCEFLISSESLKKVLAVILTLGNYMNGGNMQRGQADGFGLEILAKLKDVKSKDNQVTLLHFIVRTFMQDLEDPLAHDLALPVPEPGDINRSATVNFDDVRSDLQKIQTKLDDCAKQTDKVIAESTEETVQPFKDKMLNFLENAKKQLNTEFETLEECKSKFIATMKFYHFKPKSGTLEAFPPNEFFVFWAQFCIDFKDIWKKEQQRLIKEKVKEIKRKQEENRSNVQKVKKREGGLKSKIERLRASKNM